MQMEGNAILHALNSSIPNSDDVNNAVEGLVAVIPEGMNGEQKQPRLIRNGSRIILRFLESKYNSRKEIKFSQVLMVIITKSI